MKCSISKLCSRLLISETSLLTVLIDGIFNSDNPIGFATGMKNNPNILSQAQMLKAPDVDLFLDSQQPEIQGLCNADVFKFQNMSSLPSGTHLLNAIWSY
jgi:hypothetical protein